MDTIGTFGVMQNSFEHHPQDSRVKQTDVAPTCGVFGNSIEGKDCLIQQETDVTAYKCNGNETGDKSCTLTSDHADRVTDYTPICVHGSQDPISNTEHANSVNRNQGLENCIVDMQGGKSGANVSTDGTCPTLAVPGHDSTNCVHAVASPKLSVRRLMPVETERLMGFPDNWTRIPWRGKPADECPDAPRYKACGNSMGVNCMRWIGLGIEAVEAKHHK